MSNHSISTFNSYVIREVLANNEYGIKDIRDLISLRSMGFDHDQYTDIKKLIKEGNWNQIRSSPIGINDFEFLEVMEFSDQVGEKYIVTVYSNNALENDPRVLDLFSVTSS